MVQSVFAVQELLHAVVSQTNPPHVFGTSLQAPAPLHTEVCFSMNVPPLVVQLFAPHDLLSVGWWHAVMSVPLHTGPHSVPAPAPAHAERPPRGAPVTALQVPTLPVTSHAAHCELQPVSQQTPSTQKLDAHSVEIPQAAPFGFEQVPSEPARLHFNPDEQLAVLQHTPSTQLPDAHDDAPVQVAPMISFAVHAPSLQ